MEVCIRQSFSVRVFLRHLYENHFTLENLSLAVPEMVARRTIFREGFSAVEIERLLDAPDVETPIGKRDYAIMLLAAQGGCAPAISLISSERISTGGREKFELFSKNRKTIEFASRT